MLWNMLGSGMPSQKSKTRTTRISSPVKKKKRKKGSDIRDKKKKKTPSQSVSERTIIYFVLFAARLSSPFSKNKIWRK
jgi:flagellar hook-length control protein FliK